MTSDSTHEVICDAENVPKVFVAGAVPRLQQSSSIRSPESESERDTYPFSFQLHWRLDVSTCGTEPPWHLPPHQFYGSASGLGLTHSWESPANLQ